MTLELGIILALPALLIGFVFGMPTVRALRRRRIRRQDFPGRWRPALEHLVPLYRVMPASLKQQLEGLVLVFLAEKHFIGCAGLVIDDTIRVSIAGQACLLIMNRETDFYPDLQVVLVYPSAFFATREIRDAAGVHHIDERLLEGESWHEGKVILAWDEVRAGGLRADDGINVVVHEFAHQLDSVPAGHGDEEMVGSAWSPRMQTAFEGLRAALQEGRATLLDPYGAESPAEFFAVASETFIERPARMRELHPELYAELTRLYCIDPARWVQEPAS